MLPLLACSAARRPSASGPYIVTAEPLPEWEKTFQIDGHAWSGGDANYSVSLAPDKVLWLFGDSWVKTNPKAKGRETSRMPRNTLAIQPVSKLGARVNPGAPDFFWRIDNARAPLDAFRPPTPESWLWPLSGFRDGDRLFLFMTELIKKESDSLFNFQSTKNLLLTIDNHDSHPNQWRPVKSSIPFFRHGKSGDRVFGLANVVSGDDIYIYGVNENWLKGWDGRELILARTTSVDLSRSDFAKWRFWGKSGWVDDVEKAEGLFAGAASEMSVSYLPALKSYAAVYTESGMSHRIFARFAPRPEGPWSAPSLVYEVPDVQWSKNYFTYAAKAHPELAADGDELIITYAVNSKELGDHFNDLRIYWPRFIRAKLLPNPKWNLSSPVR